PSTRSAPSPTRDRGTTLVAMAERREYRGSRTQQEAVSRLGYESQLGSCDSRDLARISIDGLERGDGSRHDEIQLECVGHDRAHETSRSCDQLLAAGSDTERLRNAVGPRRPGEALHDRGVRWRRVGRPKRTDVLRTEAVR